MTENLKNAILILFYIESVVTSFDIRNFVNFRLNVLHRNVFLRDKFFFVRKDFIKNRILLI